jgi:hypothetical protein
VILPPVYPVYYPPMTKREFGAPAIAAGCGWLYLCDGRFMPAYQESLNAKSCYANNLFMA